MGGIILRIAADGTVLVDIYKQRLAEIESEHAESVERERENAAKEEYTRAIGTQESYIERIERKKKKPLGLYDAEQRYGYLIRYLHYHEGLTEFEIATRFKLDNHVVKKIILGGKNGIGEGSR